MKFFNEPSNRKLLIGFLILVFLLTLFDWLLFGRTPIHEIKSVTTAVSEKIKAKNLGGFAGAAQAHAVSATVTASLLDAATATPEQFKTWFDSEVAMMNQFNVSEDLIQQRYLQITRKMTPGQFAELAVLARTKSENVNQRVLAAYLLGFSGYANIGDLTTLALSPINLDSKPEAHSMAETQQVQERALRVLAINRLADLARGEDVMASKKALDQLQLISRSSTDPSVKIYAQNKLKEILK